MIGPKGLKFSAFDGCHPRVDIRKFCFDWSKLPVGLLYSKCACLSKPPHLLQLCEHIHQQNCVPKPVPALSVTSFLGLYSYIWSLLSLFIG